MNDCIDAMELIIFSPHVSPNAPNIPKQQRQHLKEEQHSSAEEYQFEQQPIEQHSIERQFEQAAQQFQHYPKNVYSLTSEEIEFEDNMNKTMIQMNWIIKYYHNLNDRIKHKQSQMKDVKNNDNSIKNRICSHSSRNRYEDVNNSGMKSPRDSSFDYQEESKEVGIQMENMQKRLRCLYFLHILFIFHIIIIVFKYHQT